MQLAPKNNMSVTWLRFEVWICHPELVRAAAAEAATTGFPILFLL